MVSELYPATIIMMKEEQLVETVVACNRSDC